MQLKPLVISNELSVGSEEGHPTFLFVPNPNEFEHHHIEITYEQANQLYLWLGVYLKKK